MERIKTEMPNIFLALIFTVIVSTICNIVGYELNIIESLPGMLILAAICIGGYCLSFIVPIKKISSVLWISILAILLASPISPISDVIVKYVGNINLNAITTPILAYAGIIIGKDWGAFKKVGFKGIIVSIFVIIGTFLISSLLGDFFMAIF